MRLVTYHFWSQPQQLVLPIVEENHAWMVGSYEVPALTLVTTLWRKIRVAG